MDVLFRSGAILIELLVLGAILYCILKAARLALPDLGVKLKYEKIIAMTIIAIGGLIMVFFTVHLIAFYPPV